MCVGKCGSSAVRDAVGRALEQNDIGKRSHGLGFRYIVTSEAASLTDCLRVGFVRNPWSRFVVFYTHRVIGAQIRPARGFRKGMKFRQAVEVACAIPDEDADHHFRSCWAQLSHEGRLVPDLIVRQETMDQGWEEVRRASRVALPLLRRLNSYAQSDWHTLYDDQTAAMIGERYARDAREFGYAWPSL